MRTWSPRRPIPCWRARASYCPAGCARTTSHTPLRCHEGRATCARKLLDGV
jgi:hypothetical protein